MDKLNALALLRITTPSKQSLSFCDAIPRNVKKWIDGLPKANVGESARQLYQALLEINQLQTTPENRLQMLELLRPEIFFVCNQLEKHFVNQAIVLDERPRKVANLCQALQHHLAIGYKLIVVNLGGQVTKDTQSLLTVALQRAIHSLCGPLVRASQLYCPVPEGLWLEMHLLYQIARSQNLHKTPVRDPQAHHTQSLSCEQSYVVALMLGCSRCNQLRQSTIAQLAQILELWGTLVTLQSGQIASSLFAINPAQDTPPRYTAQFAAGELNDAVGIDPSALVDAINEHLQLNADQRAQSRLHVPNSISLDMLQQLAAAWGDIAERTFQRTQSQGTLTLCLGMSALHYYLAGQRLFNDVLQQAKLSNAAVFTVQKGDSDIWADAFDTKKADGLEESLPFEEIQYSKPDDDNKSALYQQQAASYPTHEVSIVNISPGGYCLAWPREVPNQLQAGELLGIRSQRQDSWSIAVVRWIRQVRGGGTQMGIELIAPQAQACGLQLLRNGDSNSQYMRALLLPEISIISRPASLIVPRIPFQEGSKVNININGNEHRAVLKQRLTSTGSFNQFDYQVTVLNDEMPDSPGTISAHDGKAGKEDFDSLWKSL
ncbi:molecular chaperone [Ectopseudomonas mendocina]|uniref:Molecular chaperone n=1 Tax=Ectopseudomonas mendocina TaxID=300 RepID=A0ABZ2RE24_ECTME